MKVRSEIRSGSLTLSNLRPFIVTAHGRACTLDLLFPSLSITPWPLIRNGPSCDPLLLQELKDHKRLWDGVGVCVCVLNQASLLC